MCSVQGEINLLCWRTRSIKIPLKVFHLKNPFSENMSHNWHLWLRNWLWRKKKAQHPIQMPTRCTTLPMSQHKQKTFNTVQIHVHDLSFFSVSWAKYIVPEICGNTCLFYCLLYPAWLVECFFFFPTNASLQMLQILSLLRGPQRICENVHGLWQSTLTCHNTINSSFE